MFLLGLEGLWGKNTELILTKFGRSEAHVPRGKPLDFGVDPDQVLIRVGLWFPLRGCYGFVGGG